LVFWVNLKPFSLASQNIVDRSYRRYNLAAELPAVTEAWSLLVNSSCAFLSSLQPPSGGLIASRSIYNCHTILISHGNPAAEARTARSATRSSPSSTRTATAS
jgi:hypothetical protein